VGTSAIFVKVSAINVKDGAINVKVSAINVKDGAINVNFHFALYRIRARVKYANIKNTVQVRAHGAQEGVKN
jgi:hypothetical protein